MHKKKATSIHVRRSFFRKKFLFSLSLMLIPLIILNIATWIFTQYFLKREFEQSAIRNATYSQQQLNKLFKEIQYYRTLFIANPTMNLQLLTALSASQTSYSDAVSLRNMYYSISAFSSIRSATYSLYLTRTDSDYMIVDSTLIPWESYSDTAWHDMMVSTPDSLASWLIARNISPYPFEKNELPILTVFHRLNYGCMMIINLKTSYFEQLLNSSLMYKSQIIGLVDSTGQVLLSTACTNQEKDWLSTLFTQADNSALQSSGYYIVYSPLDYYGITCISLFPTSTVYRIPNLLLNITLLLSVFAIVMSGILAYYHTRKDYLQISRIIDIFCLAEQNKPLPKLVNDSNDVYSFILQNTVQTFVQQATLNMQLSERKYALLCAQLEALQYQINPHFLFNTLQSISIEVQKVSGINSHAVQMIGQLSDILRYSLGDPHQPIPLQKEIEISKSYVEILKHRHAQNIQVFWEYNDSHLSCKIARMLLQPLIENAIAHARQENDTLHVKVRFRMSNGLLYVKVIDDGLGMSKAKINELYHSFETPMPSPSIAKHIGLKNINTRLKLLYPSEKGLILRSHPGLGTVIEFHIPQNESKE